MICRAIVCPVEFSVRRSDIRPPAVPIEPGVPSALIDESESRDAVIALVRSVSDDRTAVEHERVAVREVRLELAMSPRLPKRCGSRLDMRMYTRTLVRCHSVCRCGYCDSCESQQRVCSARLL